MTDSNIKYLSLKKVVENNIFRVPDYQRGFSWEKEHFEALWNDLLHLQKGKIDYHYTGILTVEEIREERYQHWEDKFYFKEFDGYFIVDGQQRLTSVTILLFEIIEAYFQQPVPEGERLSLLGKSKSAWEQDYFIRHKDPEFNKPTFIFGYATDDPSDLFFKVEILEYEDYRPQNCPLEKTAYTNQLWEAKNYFKEQVQDFLKDHKHNNAKTERRYRKLAELCELLTERMMFDFKILDQALDIFMVFETMNTRGKVLSHLEKLKNRLIYLATLLQNKELKEQNITLSDYASNDLRIDIVQCWKEIYKELGRDKELLNSDNHLLRYHWIMYDSYDRKNSQAYVEELFDRKFTVSNAVHKKTKKGDISAYINSLKDSAKWWYVLHDPKTSKAREYVGDEELTRALIRLERLGYRYFYSLLFGILMSKESNKHKRDVLVAMEQYIFLMFPVSGRRSNAGSSHFYALASELYHQRNDWNLNWVKGSLQEWLHGGEGYTGYMSWTRFKQQLEPLFEDPNKKGYRQWNGLKYFLAEYNSPQVPLADYRDYTVLPIYQRAEEPRRQVAMHTAHKQEQRYLEGSLGNYILFKGKKPRNWAELSFEDIKALLYEQNPHHDLLQYEMWTAEAIAQRGKNMLTFLEDHWQTHQSDQLSETEKMDLLYLNFLNARLKRR